MDEQELNRKLAEWAGLQVHLKDTPTGKPEMWQATNLIGEYTNLGWIDFSQSLDACLKYLVPKLNTVSLRVGRLATDAFVELNEVEGWHTGKELPALALCLATEELIDREKMEEGVIKLPTIFSYRQVYFLDAETQRAANSTDVRRYNKPE